MAKMFIIICLFLIVITLIIVKFNNDKQLKYTDVSTSSSTNILNQIEEYQSQFWAVRKEAQEQINKDNSHNSYKVVAQRINQFYETVESNIPKNNIYYKQLKNIENKFKKNSDNAYEITELNKISKKHLSNTQDILTAILKEINSKDSNDYDAFINSQQKWENLLRLEQEKIKSQGSDESMEIVYNSSTQEIIKFRIWLLIKYLENIK